MRSGVVSRMRKKMLECEIHGVTLFRCKRRDWKNAPGRPFTTEYTEKCFKCILEGTDVGKKAESKPKKKHIKL